VDLDIQNFANIGKQICGTELREHISCGTEYIEDAFECAARGFNCKFKCL